MSLNAATVSQNHLLKSLPDDEFLKLSPDLKLVDLPRGKVLYSLNSKIDKVYFPEDAIVSIVTLFRNGSNLETGIIGREGMVGSSVSLKIETSPRETIVQTGGIGWQLSKEKFQKAFEKGETLKTVVLRHVFAYLEQISQTGACSSQHNINERLARWLLMCHDRVSGDEIKLTQEFIAQMLGVQRPGVTNAAMNLKVRGLIEYTRGTIRILNRKGLENAACECYQTVKNIYDQYLSLIELRKLNSQLDDANLRMGSEIQKQREIEYETNRRIQNLKNAVTGIKKISKIKIVCVNCKKVRDENGLWHKTEQTLQEKSDIKTSYGMCDECKETIYRLK
ncbi:MAG: Crp/Fnr family transcriptional regulator [Pyrinomonadaceae bacterium]|nr:Crp/Fnr family transcriptional regulator [Pyrinomonadaceae bacterium]